jgi:pantoate--beta-alanine ligase
MGALHAGHTSLMRAAARDGHFVVASIYVNPTQFSPGEDLSRYPRTPDADCAACAEAGVHLIFSPDDREMYPPGEQTRVIAGALARTMCGPHRPGHFDGVCTVVAKLFNVVQPDVAYFGQKDAQQALIIRRMVIDLCMPVRIEVLPIVREADGLAMSSRNAYLSTEERARAVCLIRALEHGRDLVASGQRSREHVEREMREKIVQIAGPCGTGFQAVTIDYVVAVDAESLESAESLGGRILLAGAVRIGRTRLIDNIVVDVPA